METELRQVAQEFDKGEHSYQAAAYLQLSQQLNYRDLESICSLLRRWVP